MAFYNLEPWGADADDLRAGVVAATVANYSGNLKKGSALRQPAHFFPGLGDPLAPAVVANADNVISEVFAGVKIVRAADREAVRKAAARPPKRKKG